MRCESASTYRLGRQKVAQTFLSAHHFSYDPATLALTNETVIIAYGYDPMAASPLSQRQ